MTTTKSPLSSPCLLVAWIAVAILMLPSMMSQARAWSSKIHLISVRQRGKTLTQVYSTRRTSSCLLDSSSSLQHSSFSTFRGSYRKTTKTQSFMALESAAYDDDGNNTDEAIDVRSSSPLEVNFTANAIASGFRSGDKIQVEVISFGPLGASVDVIAKGHAEEDMIDDAQPPLAKGLILQREISYFRELRNHVDVVRGEVLPAYVEAVRDDGKLDIGLRAYGGKAKAEEVSKMILDRLEATSSGVLPIGDKSPPDDIAQELPGVSKVSFKKAVSALYKLGIVQPGPDSITLLQRGATIVQTPPPPAPLPSQQQQQEQPPRTKQKAEPNRQSFGIKGGTKYQQGDGSRTRTSGSSKSSSSSPRRKSDSSAN